jgi:hypothetical protein
MMTQAQPITAMPEGRPAGVENPFEHESGDGDWNRPEHDPYGHLQ